MVLELPTAAIILWGPDQIQLYNDGYAVIMDRAREVEVVISDSPHASGISSCAR
jgi:hypothetical protein